MKTRHINMGQYVMLYILDKKIKICDRLWAIVLADSSSYLGEFKNLQLE